MENQLKNLAMNRRRQYRPIMPLVTAILVLTALPAAAQQAAQPAAAPAAAPAAPAAPGALPSWVKTCDTDKASKKELCIVTQEIRADAGTFIASMTLRRITGDKKYSLLATVPMGMLLKPGLKAQIDNGAPVSLLYGMCDTHVCYGLGDVDDAFVETMKGGKNLVVTTYSQQAKPVTFSMTLSGFAGVLAGKGIDPETFKKLQRARADQFKAKADQAREALVKQQEQQSGQAAPAQ